MPQYLVANYLPDDFDPSTVTEAMIEEIHALNREMIAAGVRKFACGISPAANAKTVRKQSDGTGAGYRRAVPGDQGAHGRFLDTGSRQYGRGTRVGAQGFRLLRCGGRGARTSILPRSGTRSRRKQVNNPGRRDCGICTVLTMRGTSQREATPLAPHPEGRGEEQ